jgi:hypothetical protein
MKNRVLRSLVVGGVLAMPGVGVPAAMAQDLITADDVIVGTMTIDFGTRKNLDTSGKLKEGSPALGAKDKYLVDIRVAVTTQYTGEITRQPNLFSKLIQKREQEAELRYSINLGVLNPQDLKQKRIVGKWVGTMPIDAATGAYLLEGGAAKDSPLRMSIDTVGRASGFEAKFRGRLVGKAEKKDGLASYTYKRLVGGRQVDFVVKRSDPMRFENLVLAKGPAEAYPDTTVNGRLDYDYETGNWITDGIKFRYTLDGKEVEDVVTGTIKWVEDADRRTNGKGYYDFNLRFNEEKSRGSGESAAFEKLSAEDAFFAVDNSVPCLTGRVSYQDTYGTGDTVIDSKVTYNLNANKLTKQQIVNFFKLWLVAVGPTNDE